ncbi:TPA: restriction endonuclease [Citrobacter freundii]|uniref:restriction endonuclease n=1 Tax=Citrobacter freundii TaxID=546 RepID=UPI0019051C49|nr:restriction endonuclease [Citrobacter freundii]MBJ8946549.1 restriction endonuclease [Citrobacter freundii]
MLNFKELSTDGQDLELLMREILFGLGHKVYWSGKGPDAGKDLIFVEDFKSDFSPASRKWLVQCKHKAVSGNSVGISDLDDIISSCFQHECNGYLLVTSTYPSSTVTQRLEHITKNQQNNITATYWDYVKIEQVLSSPDLWPIAQRFFPGSTDKWKIYATTSPNNWVANYSGYYFHINNRIGSEYRFYLPNIENKIAEINQANNSISDNHFFRLRSVYYNDKSGTFTWYIDYLYPHGEEPITNNAQLEMFFDDDWNQSYDFKTISYSSYSDHYDRDHYDFYDPHIGQFLLGMNRY